MAKTVESDVYKRIHGAVDVKNEGGGEGLSISVEGME